MVKSEMLRPLFENPRLRPNMRGFKTEINLYTINKTSRIFTKAVEMMRSKLLEVPFVTPKNVSAVANDKLKWS